jgi:hypothetical protein
MALKAHPIFASSESLPGEKAGLQANWGERVVVSIAVTIAVAIVAFIAVLMGMA